MLVTKAAPWGRDSRRSSPSRCPHRVSLLRRRAAADEERSARGVDAPVVEKAIEVELRELYLAARFEHTLEIGDEIERDEHRKGVPVREHPRSLAQYRPRRDAVEERRRDERAEYGLIERALEREEDHGSQERRYREKRAA